MSPGLGATSSYLEKQSLVVCAQCKEGESDKTQELMEARDVELFESG